MVNDAFEEITGRYSGVSPQREGRSRRFSFKNIVSPQRQRVDTDGTASAPDVSPHFVRSPSPPPVAPLKPQNSLTKMTTSIGIKRARWLPASEGELPIPEALGDAEPPSPFPLGGGTPLAGDLCRKLLKGATFLSEDEYNKQLAKVTASLRSPSYDLRTFHDACSLAF